MLQTKKLRIDEKKQNRDLKKILKSVKLDSTWETDKKGAALTHWIDRTYLKESIKYLSAVKLFNKMKFKNNLSPEPSDILNGFYMMNDLRPVNTNQKSFYGKAKVVDKNGKWYLISYNTLVLAIDRGKNTIYYNKYTFYSMTTRKHVNEFLNQFYSGFACIYITSMIYNYLKNF